MLVGYVKIKSWPSNGELAYKCYAVQPNHIDSEGSVRMYQANYTKYSKSPRQAMELFLLSTIYEL